MAMSEAAILPPSHEPRHYLHVHCSDCGLIIPKNEAHPLLCEVVAGRSSGTTRQNDSFGTRFSSRGVSFSDRHSSGSLSGRTYYREKQLLLCDACYEKRVEAQQAWLADAERLRQERLAWKKEHPIRAFLFGW
jgi:hypothetical protein